MLQLYMEACLFETSVLLHVCSALDQQIRITHLLLLYYVLSKGNRSIASSGKGDNGN